MSLPDSPGNAEAQMLLRHHKQGHKYLDNALSIDENSEKKDEAIDYYKLGIEEFLSGLSIKLEPGEENDKYRRIQEKMESNMMMAIERIGALNHCSPRINSIKKQFEKTRGTTSTITKTGHTRPPMPSAPRPMATANRPLSSPKTSSSSSGPPASRPTASARTTTPAAQGAIAKANGSGQDASKKPALKDLLKLPNVDKKMVEVILDEIVENKHVLFSDIVGQEKAKQALTELVILPAINPELFTGLLQPLKGLLLFGPPGNGKTMLAKAAANEAKCNFFNINSSSLTSKWVGEGEKLVRTLFAVARHLQPSIIFIDEIDSILCERKDNEHEASRRLKTEFFSQFDGMQSTKEDRILVMGATNRPFDLDTAALRRFPKRIYVGIPDLDTRAQLLTKLLHSQAHSLTRSQILELAARTDGYSGSDLNSLATEAAYGPIREKSLEDLKHCTKQAIRPISFADFVHSLSQIKVTPPRAFEELKEWNRKYGANN